MQKKKMTRNDVRDFYRNLNETYHITSVLNKILLGETEFTYMEKTTLSMISEQRLKSLKKRILDFSSV